MFELSQDLNLSDLPIDDDFINEEELPIEEIEQASLKSIHHNR